MSRMSSGFLSTPGAPPAPQHGVSAERLRHAIGHFATGVAIVTTLDADGAPVGTTANAVSSVSLRPPLVLVCFDRASLTLAALREHGAFVINVLGEQHREVSGEFARRGGSAWERVEHSRAATGAPRLHDVIASLECTVEHRLPGGDHEIVVGRVVGVATGEPGHAPLLYYRGAYASLARA